MSVYFKLEKIVDDKTGTPIDTLVKYIEENGKVTSEPWIDVISLDQFFDACVSRWGSNWDLNKVRTAILESEIN